MLWKNSLKQYEKLLFVFCQVMEKGTSELTQNAEFISGGLIALYGSFSSTQYTLRKFWQNKKASLRELVLPAADLSWS